MGVATSTKCQEGNQKHSRGEVKGIKESDLEADE